MIPWTGLCQGIVFWGLMSLGALALLVNARRGELLRGLYHCSFFLIVYSLLNYIIEASNYGAWAFDHSSKLPAYAQAVINLNLSLLDFKIILSLLTLVLWLYAYSRYKGSQKLRCQYG